MAVSREHRTSREHCTSREHWRRRLTGVLLLGVAFAPLHACTARYQDMLRDREETIRDLEDKLANSRAENTRLQHGLAEAKGDLSAARAQKRVVPATAQRDDLANLTKELAKEGLGESVQARYRHGRISIGIANRVTFAPGSTKLSAQGRAVLRGLAGVLLRRYGDKMIYVEGHTDSDPIRRTKKLYRSNRHLSAERADAVATFLTKHAHVPERRVVIMGFGAHDPVSRSNKSLNRRVEIVVAD